MVCRKETAKRRLRVRPGLPGTGTEMALSGSFQNPEGTPGRAGFPGFLPEERGRFLREKGVFSMSLKTVKRVFGVLAAGMILLFLLGGLTGKRPFFYGGIALAFLGTFWNLLFYRCPACGKFPGRYDTKFCPHCGANLQRSDSQ